MFLRLIPSWAIQMALGAVLLVVVLALLLGTLGGIAQGPAAFFDELGKTVARAAPQPAADLRTEQDLRVLLAAMPQARLRVGSIVEDQDRVVFTITAERAAVRAAVRPGDEIRVARDGSVEIAPTGIPGAVDGLQRALEDLRRRFFGR